MRIARSGLFAGLLTELLAGPSAAKRWLTDLPSIINPTFSGSHRKPLAGVYRFALLSLAVSCALVSAPAWSSDNFDLSQNDGLYTGNADSVALSKVIEKLSQMTDIPMSIAEGQDGPVSFFLEDVSIDDLIAGLSSSSMIVRRNVDGEDIIKEVVFMLGSENNDVAAADLPSGQPADAIVVDTDSPVENAEAAVQPSSNTETSTTGTTTPETTETATPATTQTE